MESLVRGEWRAASRDEGPWLDGRGSASVFSVRLEMTRRADLDVRAMHALDASTDRMKAQALAETVDTTTGFVPQVVGPLVKAGWVRSDPGPTGGYVLEVSLERLTVLDVIEAVDGPTDDGRCVVADADCDGVRPCVMHEAWTRARHELTRTLDSMSMASLDPGTLR